MQHTGRPGDRCVSSRSQESPSKSLSVSALARHGPACCCGCLASSGMLCPRTDTLQGCQGERVAWSSQSHPPHGLSSTSTKAFGEEMLFLQNVPSHWPQKPQKPVGQRVQGAYLGAEEAISLYVLYTPRVGARHGGGGRC